MKKKTPLLYSIFSLITAILYMVFLFLMDTILQSPAWLSVSVAYTGAMIFYFMVNRTVVFRTDQTLTVKHSFFRFVILVAVNYLITLGIVAGTKSLPGSPYSGSIIAGSVTLSLTYFVFHKLVFPSS